MSVEILHNLPENGRFKLPEAKCEAHELEASFSISLFPTGFSIGKPLEKKKSLPPIHEGMATAFLYPYNRTSERFLRALDGGWIPADLLDELPCKYVNGSVLCEVLDYCVNVPPAGDVSSVISPKSSTEVMPVVYEITLKPTTETIVKDVASMVDETWTYKDLMEVESKILRTAWPELQLDPMTKVHNTERKTMLRSSQSIFKHVQRSNKGSLLNRRWRLAAAAKAMAKAGTVDSSKKIALEPGSDRYTEASLEASVTSAESMQTNPFKPMLLGTMAATAQFPPSPRANIVGDSGWHEQPGPVEKSPSLLGKRENRDYGAKLEVKKFKQDSPRLEVHIDNGLPRFDQKLNQEQDNKSLPTLDQTKLDVKMNADQQKLDSTRMRDEKNGFGMDSGRHNSESQIAAQRLMQQDISKTSWQVMSPAESTQDALVQRKRIAMAQQKHDVRPFMQSYDLSSSGMSQNISAMVSGNPNPTITPSSSALLHPKDQLQASAAMNAGLSPDAMMQMQQMARRRANPLQKSSASVLGSTVNSGGVTNVNSPSTSSFPPIAPVKSEGMIVTGQKKEPIDNFMALISVAQRNGLPAKRRKVEPPPHPDGQKPSPSWQLLLVALGNTSSDDIKDSKGLRNMADSLVGGVNVRKTRCLQFQRAISLGSHYRRVRIRLVMCERGKDAMVEAVVQFGDDQDDETLNTVPHHVLPTMANAHAADIFAKQFCALLEKEGFELVEDQVQPTMARGSLNINAATVARPLPAGASALGSNMSSPRSSLINQQISAMPLGGMQGLATMQPSSPNGLATARMLPPSGNAANRHIAGFMGQPGVNAASKALHLDGTAAQLAAVQQHQTAQHLQRAQQMVMPGQLAQLNQHSAQQINPQMVAANQGQLQQFLQQQQQQRQQTQVLQQRKLMGMGSMGPMGNLGIPVSGGNQAGMGSMVGVNAMNNVGMPGINSVSASMGAMSNLNNVGQLQGIVSMGQNTGLSNLMAHPGSLTPAQMAAFSSKARGPNATARDNMTALNASNQLHASSGLPMMGQSMSRVGRVGLNTMPRAGSVGALGSPRLTASNMPAQGMYMNASQQMTPQQQFSLQQMSPAQQNGPQPINPQQLQLTQSQQTGMQVQQNPSPSLNLQQTKNSSSQQTINSPTTLLSQQQQVSSGSQQHGSVGNLGSLVGGPASPQVSSQNAGSVTSGNGMDTSGTNCNGPSISSG